MSETFKSAIPEPYRILGLQLRPLSLGRYRLLKRFDCAFVSEDPRLAKPEDLILGVLICSMRVNEFLELLQSGKLTKTIERWGNKVFKTGPWRKWLPKFLQRPSAFNYLEKVQLFRRYISASLEVPKYWDITEHSPSGAHWSHAMEVSLRGELNWTLPEIEEQALSKAIADYYKWLENKGAIQLMTEHDLELCASLEKAAGANN